MSKYINKLLNSIKIDTIVIFSIIQKIIHRYAIHLLFVTLLASTVAIGLSSFRYTDFKSKDVLAAPALGTAASNGGNITIDKVYYDGSTESDNVSLNQGGTVTVRLKFDNESNDTITGSNIKDSLPAGFTYVAGSAKNCLIPTAAETVCDSGTSAQKDALFNSLIATNGVSPASGLYDANDSGTTGTSFGNNSGILEIGKKRYLNLHFCNYSNNTTSYSEYTNNPTQNQYATGTKVSNSIDSTVTCGSAGGGYNNTAQYSGIQNLDLLNNKYFNLNQCFYLNSANDNFTNIINTLPQFTWNSGTNTSNTLQITNICGAAAYGYSADTTKSEIKSLQLLGNRYINLAHCGYINSGVYNRVGAIDTILDTQISANTSVSNTPATLVCGVGGSIGTTEPAISGMQTLDLIDKTRGKSYIEYKMIAPTTAGAYGTSANLVGSTGVTSINISDIGSANQVTVLSTVNSSSSVIAPSSSSIVAPSSTAGLSSSSVVTSSVTSNSSAISIPPPVLPKVNATINQNLTQSDPVVSGPVSYIATFSQPIDNSSLTPDDILLEGTAIAKKVISIGEITPFDGTTFEILVTASTAGTIQVSIPKAKFIDFTNSTIPRPTLPTFRSLGKEFIYDSSNNLYFQESTPFNSPFLSRIIKMMPNGTTSIFTNLDSPITAMTIDRFDNIYTLSSLNNISGSQFKITKITSVGFSSILTTTVGQDATSIAVDTIGNVYVNDTLNNLITKTNTITGVTTTFVTLLQQPTNLIVDSVNNVYTYSYGAGSSIKKILPTGAIQTIGPTGIGSYRGVYLDKSDNIYAFKDGSSFDIVKITSSGTVSTLFSTVNNYFTFYLDSFGNQYTKLSDIYNTNINLANTVIYDLSYEFNFNDGKFFFNDNSQLIKTENQPLPQNPNQVNYQIIKQTPNFKNIIKARVGKNYNFLDSSSTDNVVTLTQASLGTPQATLATPVEAYLGEYAPAVNLIGTSILNGTPATLDLQGSSTPILGQIFGSAFVANAGQIIPANATLGANNATLNSFGLTINVSFEIKTKVVATITQADGQVDPTSSSTVKFKVTFNKPIDLSSLTSDKFRVNGPVTPTPITSIVQVPPNNATVFEVTVAVTGVGIVDISIPGTTTEGEPRLFTNVGKSPIDYTIDNLGNLYTLNNGSANINKITPAGVLSVFATLPAFNYTAILADSSNNIYVVDNTNQKVLKITPAGVISILGNTGVDPTQMIINASGNLYVLNNEIINTNQVVASITKITQLGSSSLFYTKNIGSSSQVTGLALDSSDNIYLSISGSEPIDANSSRAINLIEKISPSGISTVFSNEYSGKLTFDKAGNLYATGGLGGGITKLNTLGIPTNFATNQGNVSIIFDLSGNAFVLFDNGGGNAIIKRLSPSGQLTFYANVPSGNIFIKMVVDNNDNIYVNYSNGILPTSVNTITKIQGKKSYQVFDAARSGYNLANSVAVDNQITIQSATPDCPGNGPIQVNYNSSKLNIFSSINVHAQTTATAQAAACGVIYIPLEATINQAATQIDPATTSPVKFTVVFNQPIDVSTFTAADIALSGTATGLSVASITQVSPNDGTTFEVLVNATIPQNSANTTVIANLPAKTSTNSIQSTNPDTPVFNDSAATFTDNIITLQGTTSVDTSTFVTIVVPPITNNPRPTITGTCETGGSVTVTITTGTPSTNINQTLPVFTCVGGTYSVVPPANVPDGPYCGNATIIDPSNNTATATPSCGVIDTSTFVTIVVPPITNNPRPTITGTCETGGSVTVTITTGTPSTNINQTLPVFTCVGGTYSVVPPANVPDGPYCIRSSIVDVAGNTASTTGCGSIFITVSVPASTTDNKPIITGICTASVVGGFQVPVSVVIKIGSNYGTINETIITTCSTAGTYSVRPTIIIAPGAFQVVATATDSIGNQAEAIGVGNVLVPILSSSSSALSSVSVASSSYITSGGIVVITTSSTTPEVFDNISDPYECGKSISGKVTSNYGIKSVIVKLFVRRGDGSYEAEPKYVFTPVLDSNNSYEIKLNYPGPSDSIGENKSNNQTTNFVEGMYKVEYTSESKSSAIKSGSYLANLTDKCKVVIPTILIQNTEITPEGKVTVRTGGSNELYYISLALVTALATITYVRLRRRSVRASEVFGR